MEMSIGAFIFISICYFVVLLLVWAGAYDSGHKIGHALGHLAGLREGLNFSGKSGEDANKKKILTENNNGTN